MPRPVLRGTSARPPYVTAAGIPVPTPPSSGTWPAGTGCPMPRPRQHPGMHLPAPDTAVPTTPAHQRHLAPIRLSYQPAGAGTATPGHGRTRSGPARGHRGGCAPATAATANTQTVLNTTGADIHPKRGDARTYGLAHCPPGGKRNCHHAANGEELLITARRPASAVRGSCCGRTRVPSMRRRQAFCSPAYIEPYLSGPSVQRERFPPPG